ncbi:SoxR reducing system RseC family protein [Shewanella sp. 202IG2-18]|uniref:SoxR reducing system RseC family protein n=1 Tax=Parashewanella hymeniacidonis TaxID=2807618 RepID=UPI0019619B06|nr:SoxR reducing system RseC family protein [Parashewanella hymeniacidonis]MBM7072616.1 SoxR reducing system RseC family protein [Parashewanella hymeniacidonis]
MMEELAKVVSDSEGGWVSVEVELKSACHSCHNDENCGTAAVAKAFSPKTQAFAIQTQVPVKIGEMVKIGLPESVVLKAAALVYLLPLFGFFASAFLGTFLFEKLGIVVPFTQSADIPTILFGGLGAFIAWLFGRIQAKNIESIAQPVILSRLGHQIN